MYVYLICIHCIHETLHRNLYETYINKKFIFSIIYAKKTPKLAQSCFVTADKIISSA